MAYTLEQFAADIANTLRANPGPSGKSEVCQLVACALNHYRTHAPRQTSGRALPVVSFVYLSVECPLDKFYGINCRPKLDAKLLDRFSHRQPRPYGDPPRVHRPSDRLE